MHEARNLNMFFYIPTRYPNGLSGELPPTEFYEEEDARRCLRSAELILQTVKNLLEKKLAQKLKNTFPIEKIYLYGSFARGEIHEGSDIDLPIIGDFRERFFERIGLILGLTGLPIEPLVYIREELQQPRTSQNPFIEEILRTGVEL